MRFRRVVQGFTDLGRIQRPPLPIGIVMTDRADGTLWLLSHDADAEAADDNGRIMITNTFDDIEGMKVFGPNDGPYISEDNTLRLFIRDGRIGYEIDHLSHVNTGRVLTRNDRQRITREIVKPDPFTGGRLGWNPLEFGNG